MYETWTVQVSGKIATNLDVGRLIVYDECYVSANTKLCDFSISACLSSEALAKRYADALEPVFRIRYGEGVRLTVADRGPQGRPEFDDPLVEARIEQGIFAPNRKPAIVS